MSRASVEDNVYETEDSLNQYLGLHFPSSGKKEGIPAVLPHELAPTHLLGFPQRVARLLIRFATTSSSSLLDRALDMGCAVGGASFELAKTYRRVDAFDYSQSFVTTAQRMQRGETVRFRVPVEADLYQEIDAVHQDGVTPQVRERVHFFVGDACNPKSTQSMLQQRQSSSDKTKYDGVIMANLLCRLPDPMACLNQLPDIVRENGGLVVLVTPYSWLDHYTERSQWLGGYYEEEDGGEKDDPNDTKKKKKKKACYSKDRLKQVMESNGFALVHEEPMPLLIREHQRKYQYIVSEATVWKRS